jgi:hypothetical protein
MFKGVMPVYLMRLELSKILPGENAMNMVSEDRRKESRRKEDHLKNRMTLAALLGVVLGSAVILAGIVLGLILKN